tara:strand:- start:443 stop:1240 length:798 start_codon:yes stop_codon:yes gene_type:complete
VAKRFIDTKIWDKAWFRKLSTKNKLVWIYLLGKCDHAGIWDADWELAEFIIGETVTYEELPDIIKDKMKHIKGEEQYFIPSFIEFQYGELKEHSKPHKSVIKRLTNKNLYKGYERVILTPKDKEQDKVKVKVKEKSKNIDEREKEFMSKCKTLQDKYEFDNVMLMAFVDFWTESNEGGKLMRYEMQKTFDIGRRMSKWKANDKEWNINSPKKKQGFMSKFQKTPTGVYKAWCSKCGDRQFPNNEYQIKQGSSCCAVDYLPEKVNV